MIYDGFGFEGMKCPHCGNWHSVVVDEFPPSFGQEWAILHLFCRHCLTTWTAVYKFDHDEEIDVLETREEA